MPPPNKIAMSARRKRAQTRKPGDNRPSALGYSQFAWLPREMLESPAFRSLSINSFRLLMALWVEHLAHGGCENGWLIFTHEQLKSYGLTGSKIRGAIDELVAFGFITVKAGGRRAMSNQPNRYRIAWLWAIDAEGDPSPPSARWKSMSSDDVARWHTERSQMRAAKGRWKLSNKLGV